MIIRLGIKDWWFVAISLETLQHSMGNVPAGAARLSPGPGTHHRCGAQLANTPQAPKLEYDDKAKG